MHADHRFCDSSPLQQYDRPLQDPLPGMQSDVVLIWYLLPCVILHIVGQSHASSNSHVLLLYKPNMDGIYELLICLFFIRRYV